MPCPSSCTQTTASRAWLSPWRHSTPITTRLPAGLYLTAFSLVLCSLSCKAARGTSAVCSSSNTVGENGVSEPGVGGDGKACDAMMFLSFLFLLLASHGHAI